MKRSMILALASSFFLTAPVWAADTDKPEQTKPEQTPTESDIETDYPNRRIYFGEANPASFAFYGSGRIQMPSLRFDIGSTLSTDQAIQDVQGLSTSFQSLFGQLGSSTPLDEQSTQLQTQLQSFLGQFQGGARLGYDLDYNIFSFGGAPFAQLRLANRPLYLGVGLGSSGRGYLEANFSDAFTHSLTTLTDSIPDIVNTGSTVTQISNQAGTVISQVNTLNNDIDEMVAITTNFFANPLNDPNGQAQNFTDKMSQVGTEIETLLPTARKMTSSVKSTTSTARNLLSAFEAFSGGGVQVTSVNDLHVTLGLSGAYPVFENDDIKIALGTRLKLFMLPYNVPLSQFGFQTNAGLLGKLELNEITGLKNIDALKETLDTFEQATQNIETVIDAADKVSTSINKVEDQLNQTNGTGLAALATTLASGSGQQLVSDANTFTSSVSDATASAQKAASEVSAIQQTLLTELKDVKLKGSITTPSGAGFGMDFGVDALLYKNLRLGLMLQNPIVLWPATETPFEASMVQNQNGQALLQPDLLFDSANAKSVNYNGSVPLSILMTGRYRFDDLLPATWEGLYVNSMLEFVFNGRKPAFVLGARKMFGDLFYCGLGGRVGGLSNLLYLETGLNPLEGFGMDLQLGISPTGNGLPAQNMSWLGMGRLGLSYRF